MTYRAFMVFMVVAMLNLIVGCSVEKSLDANVDNTTLGEPNLTVHPPGPPPPGFIQKIFDTFEPFGYEYAPEHVATMGFTAWPEGMSDSVHGTITYYPMEYVADAAASVAYIEYVQTEVVSWVQPFIVSFVEPPEGEGYELLADSLWSKSFLPTRTDSGKYQSLDMAASPKGFGACWLAGSVGGCTTAGIVCIGSGPGWPACAGLGCGGSIIGSEIACAILSWLS